MLSRNPCTLPLLSCSLSIRRNSCTTESYVTTALKHRDFILRYIGLINDKLHYLNLLYNVAVTTVPWYIRTLQSLLPAVLYHLSNTSLNTRVSCPELQYSASPSCFNTRAAALIYVLASPLSSVKPLTHLHRSFSLPSINHTNTSDALSAHILFLPCKRNEYLRARFVRSSVILFINPSSTNSITSEHTP